VIGKIGSASEAESIRDALAVIQTKGLKRKSEQIDAAGFIEHIRGELIPSIQGESISVTVSPLNAFSLACRKELEDILRSAL
jgi:hypothetical protein